MKIRTIPAGILIFLLNGFCHAQEPDRMILMTVAGREVEAGEFISMFNKSLAPHNKNDINTFLEQFIDFKLKVADAVAAGYDTTRAFREELNGYRNQLAQGYLTDSEIKQKLLLRAYERSKYEVKASHILISLPSDASPDDTASAFGKAVEIRQRIIGGEPFERVARAVSDDKSVVLNGGNLGYFNVFQMISPFEDAAYTLPAGTISMPVRTQFGYHLILATDKRPSRGKIKVAHIMKAAPPGSHDSVIQRAEKEITGIYSQLKAGASFHQLAERYSDHKESSVRGGVMDTFGTGEIIPDFSEAAFAISDTGEFTKPVRTPYGFHIIKLLGKVPPLSFEEAKPYLESKLNRTDLNTAGKNSFVSRLKREYNFRIDSASLNWFFKNTDTLTIKGKSLYSEKKIPAGSIFTFDNRSISNTAFTEYIGNKRNMVMTGDPYKFVTTLLESMTADCLISYEDSTLEEKYPEFRYLMREFHDGILLFDISSVRIWNKVQEDSAGLKAYYEIHKNDFLSKKSIIGRIYALRIQDKGQLQEKLKKLESACRRLSGNPDMDRILSYKFNRKGDTVLIVTEGKWFEGVDPDIDSIKWNPGIQYFRKNGIPSLILVEKVEDQAPLPFEEVKSEVLNSYQDWITEQWIKELKLKYSVRIEDAVLNDVKRRVGDE